MKNRFLILGLISKWILVSTVACLPALTYAYEGTIAQSGSCGTTNADCHYDLYEDGHLEISGTGKMSSYANTSSPWGRSIKTVSINGITEIGHYAFVYATNLETIQMSNSIESIGIGAFEATGFSGDLVIPESVTRIHSFAFSRIGNANLTIEGSPKLSSDALVNTKLAAIYCVQSIDCANKGIYDGVNSAGTVVPYERQAGVYRLEDGTIFSSPNDMMSGTNACADLDTCKAAALEYNGYCTGDACTAMVMAENTNHPIEYHNKSYASIDDLFEGKYLPKRIYTVEEAHQAVEAAGTDTVNFRIRYK